MSLVSTVFIFLFLPIVVLLNYFLPNGKKNYILLAANAAFYWFASENIFSIALMFAVAALTWLLGTLIGEGKLRAPLLALGVLLNIGLLVFFKYYGLIPQLALRFESLVFPLGLSYFAFRNTAYLHGVYKGDEFEDDLVAYLAYSLLFAQVIQGPIQKYSEFSSALHEREIFPSDIGEGAETFVIGFGMNRLLAVKPLALCNSVMNAGFDAASTVLAWMTLLAYIVCLYFDFYGYTLMAEGICRMLGFRQCKNFDQPYSSRSVSEFWRRWHISLGVFFKENVYFPLGGSRSGTACMIISTFVVWMLTGMWHGDGLTFIVWGFISFVLIISEKLSAKHEGPLYKLTQGNVLSRIYVVIYAFVSWSVFMADDLGAWTELWKRLIPITPAADYVDNLDFIQWIPTCGPAILAGLIFLTPYPAMLWNKIKDKKWLTAPILLIVFWVSVYVTSVSGANPFMYADF